MTEREFRAIEIDSIDDALTETAKRKRIPSMRVEPTADAASKPETNGDLVKSEFLGGVSGERKTIADVGPKPVRKAIEQDASDRPAIKAARRRPISLEMPDYLARDLKIKAAREAVTVRHLILTALFEAGYHVEAEDMEEDGRRLR